MSMKPRLDYTDTDHASLVLSGHRETLLIPFNPQSAGALRTKERLCLQSALFEWNLYKHPYESVLPEIREATQCFLKVFQIQHQADRDMGITRNLGYLGLLYMSLITRDQTLLVEALSLSQRAYPEKLSRPSPLSKSFLAAVKAHLLLLYKTPDPDAQRTPEQLRRDAKRFIEETLQLPSKFEKFYRPMHQCMASLISPEQHDPFEVCLDRLLLAHYKMARQKGRYQYRDPYYFISLPAVAFCRMALQAGVDLTFLMEKLQEPLQKEYKHYIHLPEDFVFSE